MSERRVGIGYDVHAFGDGRKLVLGGVEFPDEQGLEGHSDADVVAHAVIDALLGAAGLGDIGQQFPDSDERFTDADSIGLLQGGVAARRRRRLEGRQRRPDRAGRATKDLRAWRRRCRRGWRDALGILHAHVNVKATTGEGLGFVGRGEGIAAIAVALIER